MSENKKSQRKVRRAKQKRQEQLKTIKTIVIVGIILLVAFVVPNLVPREVAIPDSFLDYSMAEGTTIGSADAPVLVEEYSDFQCPFCLRWFDEVEPALLNTYVNAGVVRFEYHTAGEFLGPESRIAAEGAFCANDQGKFWQMKETIFFNQPQGENTGFYSNATLSNMADGIGLDVVTFDACMESNKYEQQIIDDYEIFASLGLSGTPSILVNGVPLSDPSIQSISAAVEAALSTGQ